MVWTLTGCRHVHISRCDFDCGDDAISPKTLHPDWPNENFTITDCRMKSEWAAIRLGPESVSGMRHFDVRNCEFTDCRDGIKIESCEGAVFEDLSFSGITMRDVNRPLYITATRFNFSAGKFSSASTRRTRPQAAAQRDRCCRGRAIRPAPMTGMHAHPIVALHDHAIEDVTLSHVNFTFPGGGTQEQASRLDVAEMLHFHDYMQSARPFDGELPAAVLYLRHLRRATGERAAHGRGTRRSPLCRW